MDNKVEPLPLSERATLSIPEFCAVHGFSPAFYFNLQKEGKGPRVLRVGKRVLITREAAAEWRQQREAATATVA